MIWLASLWFCCFSGFVVQLQIMKFLQKHKDCKIDKISSDLIDDIEYSVTDEGWLRILPNGKETVKNRDGFFIASLKKVSWILALSQSLWYGI